MNAIRILAGLLITCVATVALDRCCVRPYKLNQVKKTVEKRTFAAYDSAQADSAAIVARQNLEMLAKAHGDCNRDIDVCMEIAANERLLGRRDDAIRTYERALVLDRRPEIFYNLGITQLDNGQREAAIESFVRAIAFNPDAGYIADPDVNAEVHRRIAASVRPR